jgi:large subunit ribosomal protein L25
MIKLKANKRDEKSKAENLRNEGLIPVVIYGPKQEAISATVNFVDFKKAYEEAGESTIVTISLGKEDYDTLIHDVQYDAVKGLVLHVDFYAVEKGKKIQVPVKLEYVGVSPAEKTLGGILVKVMHELEIESMPKDLPSELEVNIESLVDFDSQIHARDIVLPQGVELITDPDEVIALVKEAKEEEEEAPVVDLEAIEVEKKGKTEEATTE